jgi:hypothetical protein
MVVEREWVRGLVLETVLELGRAPALELALLHHRRPEAEW